MSDGRFPLSTAPAERYRIERSACRTLARVLTAQLALTPMLASTAGAQSPAVISGHIQDAASAGPVAGALIIAGDSLTSVHADSAGNFAIEMRGNGPYILHAVMDGYEPRSYTLPGTSRSVTSTLLLRQMPDLRDMLSTGDRVRVRSDRGSGEFVVSGVGSGSLRLRTEPESEVPIGSLNQLQIMRGREISRAEGLFGGGAIGALLGGVFAIQASQDHYEPLLSMSPAASVLLGTGLGAMVGLLVSRRSGEVWEEVALHGVDVSPRQEASPDVSPIVAVGDLSSADVLEMIVRNQTPGPIEAYAWWEGGGRLSLGVVRANSTSTFVTARRSPGIALAVTPLSSPGLPTGAPRPSQFIVAGAGERLQWTVLAESSGIVEDYLRLTPR